MRFLFRKSFKILPGIKLNFYKNSFGASIGCKNARIGINSKNGLYASASIPKTGLYCIGYLFK